MRMRNRFTAAMLAIAFGVVFVPAVSAEPMDCLFFDGVEGGQAPTAAMEEVRWLHNCIRRTAEPRPSPRMPDLRWNATVATSAQSWANQCTFQHPGGHPYGENLAAGTANALDEAALTVLWIEEYPDYDYGTNTCAPNQVCGHYTQMVWRETTQIGCGVTVCPTLPPSGMTNVRYLVCRYDPPGNWIGERPY